MCIRDRPGQAYFRLIFVDSFPKTERRPATPFHLDRLTQGVKRPQERSHIYPQMWFPPQAKSIFYIESKLSLTDSCASPKLPPTSRMIPRVQCTSLVALIVIMQLCNWNMLILFYWFVSVSLIISYILLYHSFLNLSIKLLHACDVFTHFCHSNLQEGPHL